MGSNRPLIATGFLYFAAVADHGSIRAAARKLSVSPSAINRQILLIERTVGIDLFERIGRGLKLSQAGALLLQNVRETQRSHDDVLSAIDGFRGLKRGKVSVATVESVSVTLLPDLLAGFAIRYPGITITVAVAGSDAVAGMVRDGGSDLGFTFNPNSLQGLDVLYERAMTVGALMAPDHPLAGRKRVCLADCIEFPVALPVAGLSLRTILDTNLRRRRMPMRPVFEANSLRLMSALARRGRCIAFQTTIGIEQELAAGTLRLVPLSDQALPLDRLTLVRQAGRKGSPASAALCLHFIEHLRVPPKPKVARRVRVDR